MTIDERIKQAKKKLNEAYRKDSVQGIVYWDGYLDALNAVKEDHDSWLRYVDECAFNQMALSFSFEQMVADHLLAHGVIVPPCYIGQEIWHITKHYDGRIEIRKGKVSMLQQKSDKSWKIRITVNSSVWDFTPNEIGTEYFLTREEAEKALAERREG